MTPRAQHHLSLCFTLKKRDTPGPLHVQVCGPKEWPPWWCESSPAPWAAQDTSLPSQRGQEFTH